MIDRVMSIGHLPGDSRYARTRMTTLVVTTIIGAIVVIPWGLFYIAIGLVFTGLIPITYAALSAIGIAQFDRTKDDRRRLHGDERSSGSR